MRTSIVALTAAASILACALPSAMAQAPAQAAPLAQTMRVSVRVEQAGAAPVAGAAVELRAARPKGPFEPADPKPVETWRATSGADGVAHFDRVPADLARRGLRLRPIVTWSGMTFKGAAAVPSRDVTLAVRVAERGFDVGAVRMSSVRFIVEPWEGYLVFSQLITLGVASDRAIDTTLLPGEAYKEGLPIELPIKAQGIRVFGSEGDSKVVDSTVYWRGVLTPGSEVSLQLRYSIAAHNPSFVYTQTYAYPVGALEVIVPVETRHTQKLARMEGVGLQAPGFPPDQIRAGTDIPGLPPGKEFVWGKRTSIPAGTTIQFRLYNLPFERSVAPWIALGLGLIGAIGVLAFARVERRRARGPGGPERLRAALERERVEATERLRAIERSYQDGDLIERDYEIERARARTHLALVLRKLSELDEPVASAAELG